MKRLFLLIFGLAIFISCDKIDEPLKSSGVSCLKCNVTESENFITEKIVLIEEFTGATCNNCPKATDEANQIIADNPGKVLLLGIHSSNFAVPDTVNGYTADFRTDVGSEIYTFANPLGLPAGLVDRTDQGSASFNKSYLAWENKATTILSQSPNADIGLLATSTYDDSSKTVCLVAKFKAMADLSNRNINWTGFLAENGIIAPQKLPDNSKKSDYEHNHVLRAGFNGAFGESIPDFTGEVNSVACSSRAVDVLPDWNTSNLEAFVLAYDTDTYEILQAIKVKVN